MEKIFTLEINSTMGIRC